MTRVSNLLQDDSSEASYEQGDYHEGDDSRDEDAHPMHEVPGVRSAVFQFLLLEIHLGQRFLQLVQFHLLE